jgi:hypothetical protein
MSKIIVKSSDGIMSLRDTRMYNPRSESSYMFRNNDEDETTYTGNEDGAYRDEMTEKKKKKRADRKKEMSKLKHIKIKPSEIVSISDDDEQEEDEKLNREVEPSKLTGPPGNMGFLTSLANQAKGPGAAGGHAFATGEPMEISFQLLKAKGHDERQGFIGTPKKEKKSKTKKDKKVAIRAKKDKKERSKKWRPSTGQFKMPPGGMNPQSATGRRAKARMRGIKGAKKTGLSRAHLAVEMSHRGVKTKQPQSKDPRKYRQYMGQQEGRKRLGGVRTVSSQPARFGTRSYSAGPTGAGMLQGRGQMVRRPALKPHRTPPIVPPRTPRAPSMPQLAMPSPPPISQPSRGVAVQGMAAQGPMFNPSRVPTSSVQGVMTGPIGEGSELQKKGLSYYDIAELRQLVNDARRALKRKESKKKSKGTGDTSGGGSNLPAHSENGPVTSTKPEGATEDETDARRFGINPLDLYTSRGGRTP